MATQSSILAWRIPWTGARGVTELDTTELSDLSTDACKNTEQTQYVFPVSPNINIFKTMVQYHNENIDNITTRILTFMQSRDSYQSVIYLLYIYFFFLILRCCKMESYIM